MRNYSRYMIGFLLFIAFQLKAQDAEKFQSKLQTADDFYQSMEIINEEYRKLPQEIRDKGGEGYMKEKHYRRWEWYMSHHLDKEGKVPNISELNLKATKEMNQASVEQKSTASSWFNIGPISSSYGSTNGYCIYNGVGRVNRVAFDPIDPNIVYIGMPEGGIWKTTDGGAFWESMMDNLPSLGISGIVVSYANPNIVYALTGDGDTRLGTANSHGFVRTSAGVFKSTDGGITWAKTGNFPSTDPFLGYQLVQNPNDPDLLYAATDQGLFRTTNGGDDWTMVYTGLVYDVAIRPGTNRVYICTDTSVWFSDTVGMIWNQANFNFSPQVGRKVLAVSPANNTTVYLLSGPVTGNGSFDGLYRSTDSGANFTRRSNTPNIFDNTEAGNGNTDQSWYDICMVASLTDINDIFTGACIVFESSNGGLTWNNTTTYAETGINGGSWYVHPDIHDLEYNPLDGKLYAAHDGGISVSDDDGATWTDLNNFIRAATIYHLDKDVDGSLNMAIGNQDNGTKYRTVAGQDFEHVQGGDGFYPSIDETDNTRFIATGNSSLFLFTANGDNRDVITPVNSSFFMTAEMHNTDKDKFFIGTDNLMMITDDEGANWTTVSDAKGGWSIATCPSNNNRIYCTGGDDWSDDSNGGVYRTNDGGTTWTDLTTSPGFPTSFTRIPDINVNPTNSSRVWMVMAGYDDGNKVYKSNNAGGTWSNISGSLPNVPVYCVAITSDEDVFIGTEIGVFFRSSSMSDWIPFSNRLANVAVTDIRIDESDNSLYVSTFGRGIYKTYFGDLECETDLTLTTALDGGYYYEASNNITSTASINGTANNSTYYMADNSITLKPGFGVGENAFFRAYLDNCGAGGVPGMINPMDTDDKRFIKDGNKNANASRFNIHHIGNTVEMELFCFKSEEYQIELLDENLQSIKVMHTANFEKGSYTLELGNLETHDEGVYIVLRSGGRNIYLQEF